MTSKERKNLFRRHKSKKEMGIMERLDLYASDAFMLRDYEVAYLEQLRSKRI